LLLLIVSLTVPVLPQATKTTPQEPPEEDLTVDPKTQYVLNPLQAEKEVRIGNYYFKKGSYKAASRRYEEAVKWDPNSAEGWYKVGEAQEKLGNAKLAREAWAKYVELQPDGKFVAQVKKKLTQNQKP
jgi:predicted TPR repeat methyltransferase